MKPGGKIVVDYAQPCWWHPARYLWRIVLGAHEPYALDLWRDEVAAWMPAEGAHLAQAKGFFAGPVTALGSVGVRPFRRLPQSDSTLP